MQRKRNVAATPIEQIQQEVPPGDDAEGIQQDGDQALSAADRIAAVLQGMDPADSRAKVRVSRRTDTGEFAYCQEFSASEFEARGLDVLRDTWGGGVYRVMVYGPLQGTNKWGLHANVLIEIAERITPAASSPAAGTDPRLLSLLEAMERRISSMEAERRIDPLQQLQQTMTLAKQMREALGVGESRGNGLADSIRELRNLFEIEGMVRERVNPAPPLPERADPLLELAPKIIDIVQAAMSKGQQPAAPLPHVALPPSLASVPMAPATPTAMPAAQPINDQNGTEGEAVAMIEFAVRWLQSQAGQGAKPEEAAETVYEHAPDEILELLRRDTWFEELTQIAPTIAGIRDWLGAVRAAVLKIVGEEAGASPQNRVKDANGRQDASAPTASH